MIFSLLRAASTTPWLSVSNPAVWTPSSYTAVTSTSGETVTPEAAMKLAANWACIDVISTDESVYPINIYRRTGAGKSVLANDIKAAEYRLLNSAPNANSTAITARRHIVSQALQQGNGFWEIQRLGNGELYQLHQIQSANMVPKISAGLLYWEYRDGLGEVREIQSADLIHLVGATDNGYVGVPMIYYASECLGAGLAQQKFEGAFFGNGTMLSGVLTHPGALQPEQEKRILDSWAARHSGEAGQMWKTALLPTGMEWKSTAVNPKDALLIEARRYTVEEVCRWYRMPPEKIMAHLQAKGWNTTEAGNKSYLLETLMPWCERLEAELDRKFFGGGEEFYTAHDYRRLLEPDANTRADRATKLFSVGAMTMNELREAEGLNPIGKDGDTHFVPVNLQPLDRALNPPEPAPQPARQLPAPGSEPEDDEGDAEARHRAFVLRTLERTAARLLRKEGKAASRLRSKHTGGELAAHLEAFAQEFSEEMAQEFAEVMGCGLCAALLALCNGYCDDAVAAYSEADREAERYATLPAVWARQVWALVTAIGEARHA